MTGNHAPVDVTGQINAATGKSDRDDPLADNPLPWIKRQIANFTSEHGDNK